MSKKKIALGVAVVVLFWTIGNELINLLRLPIPPTAQSFVVSLLASGFGALAARRNFLIPALVTWAACWAIAIYMLYLIAAPTGHVSIVGIIRYNTVAIALSAFATTIGVTAGHALAQRSQSIAAAT